MSKLYIKIGTAVAENEISPLSSRTWSGTIDACLLRNSLEVIKEKGLIFVKAGDNYNTEEISLSLSLFNKKDDEKNVKLVVSEPFVRDGEAEGDITLHDESKYIDVESKVVMDNTIGVLWVRDGEQGEWISGFLNAIQTLNILNMLLEEGKDEYPIKIVLNEHKESEKQPSHFVIVGDSVSRTQIEIIDDASVKRGLSRTEPFSQ